MFRSSVRLLILLIGFAVAAGLPDRVHAAESSGVLVLGRVSDDPKSQYEQMKVLLDYVVERMGDVGIHEGRILMARDAVQMASYLRRGRVDWVSETAAAGMLLQQRADADTLVLSERNGIRRYHTIYFTRRDSPIKSIDQLRGHRIAFQNQTSTSAYFIPAMELLQLGLPMEILGSPFDAPVASSVGYVFGRTERNIATWVHKGLVDVGALNNLDWSDPQHIPEFFKSDLVIIRESEEVPRGVEMVRKDLDERIRARLRVVLLEMGDDPVAVAELARFHQALKFFDLDERDRRDLKRLHAGVIRVTSEIE